MAQHDHSLYSAWDAAMDDLMNATHDLRAAVQRTKEGDESEDLKALVDQLSERKRRAMDAWVAYTDASGFGRI